MRLTRQNPNFYCFSRGRRPGAVWLHRRSVDIGVYTRPLLAMRHTEVDVRDESSRELAYRKACTYLNNRRGSAEGCGCAAYGWGRS